MANFKSLIAACWLGLSLALATAVPALAADPVYTGFFSNMAVSGYDPVAYFKDGKPVKGSKKYTLKHEGATWRFSSAENREAFRANPDAYAPQYGGYCAWAVSEGYTASGDPQQWAIVDSKLYLNYDAEVKADWLEDVPGHISKANENWPRVLD